MCTRRPLKDIGKPCPICEKDKRQMHDIIAQYLFDTYTSEGEPIPKFFHHAPYELVEEFLDPGTDYHMTAENVRQELNYFVENYYSPD